MADRMIFPKTIQEFIKEYSFKDKKEYYTNGSMLIPVFRMEQAHVYYGKQIRDKAIDEFMKEIRDWQIDIQHNEHDADKFDFVFERIYEIAEQIKTEVSM